MIFTSSAGGSAFWTSIGPALGAEDLQAAIGDAFETENLVAQCQSLKNALFWIFQRFR